MLTNRSRGSVPLLIGLASVAVPLGETSGQRARDMVDVRLMIPDIVLEIRYFTSHNFIGRPIPSYEAGKCLLTQRAAEALSRVQEELRDMDLALKAYDCYRPQSAVNYFVDWARDLNDQAMKAEFYPSIDKSNLFRDGYIAERSGHSRGSTIDLTVVPLSALPATEVDATGELKSCEGPAGDRSFDTSIDMGTAYDCFSILSHTINSNVGAQQRANRLLLKHLMESNGFVNLPEEWWHFTLSNEPHPESYFDFPVR